MNLVNRNCSKYQQFYCQTASNFYQELIFKENEIVSLIEENRLLRQKIDILEQIDLKRIRGYSFSSLSYDSAMQHKISILENFICSSFRAINSSSCRISLEHIDVRDLTCFLNNIENSVKSLINKECKCQRHGTDQTKGSFNQDQYKINSQNQSMSHLLFENQSQYKLNNQHQANNQLKFENQDQYKINDQHQANNQFQLKNQGNTPIRKSFTQKYSLNDIPSNSIEDQTVEPQNQEVFTNYGYTQQENLAENEFNNISNYKNIAECEFVSHHDPQQPVEIPLIQQNSYIEKEKSFTLSITNNQDANRILNLNDTSSKSSKLSLKSIIKDKPASESINNQIKSTPKIKQVKISKDNIAHSSKGLIRGSKTDLNSTKQRKLSKSNNNNNEIFDKLSKKSGCSCHNFEYYYGSHKSSYNNIK